MKETTKVFQIKTIVSREEDGQTIIFDYNKRLCKWIYHAPNAQDYTEEQIEAILKKLKELNEPQQ